MNLEEGRTLEIMRDLIIEKFEMMAMFRMICFTDQRNKEQLMMKHSRTSQIMFQITILGGSVERMTMLRNKYLQYM